MKITATNDPELITKMFADPAKLNERAARLRKMLPKVSATTFVGRKGMPGTDLVFLQANMEAIVTATRSSRIVPAESSGSECSKSSTSCPVPSATPTWVLGFFGSIWLDLQIGLRVVRVHFFDRDDALGIEMMDG